MMDNTFSDALSSMVDKLTVSSYGKSSPYNDPKVYSGDAIAYTSKDIASIVDSSHLARSLTAVYTKENNLEVKVLLPLVHKDSIKISLHDGKNLNIQADFFNIFTDKEDKFEYVLSLSSSLCQGHPIDRTQKFTAKYTDGVLTIGIPLVPKEIIEITLE